PQPAAINQLLVSARSALHLAQSELRQSGASGHSVAVGATATAASGSRGPSQDPTEDYYAPTFGPTISFSLAQRWMETALSDRLARIGVLSSSISSSATLTSSDRTGISGLVGNAQSVCNSLSQSVPGDSSNAQLQLAADQMIGSLHVFAVLSPQVNETVAADSANAAAAKLQALAPGLNTAIAAASGSSRQISRLQNLEQNLVTEANAAASFSGPLPAELIGLSDASLSSITSLNTAMGSERSALYDLELADYDLRQLLNLLSRA
ncbi:MAG TPA: hypothetical protein VMD59_08880, partial [Acidimicrobiales bacterium]|nr:hypothetical protein [Acidimicrobiales bacterium]